MLLCNYNCALEPGLGGNGGGMFEAGLGGKGGGVLDWVCCFVAGLGGSGGGLFGC